MTQEHRAAKEAFIKTGIWLAYRKDPLFWLQHRFKENPLDFEWSKREAYTGHKWDGSVDPLAQAWRALAEGNWVAIEAATGTSKTYMLSRIVFWFLDVYKDSLVVTSAPKQDQLKLHLWSELSKAFYKFKKVRPDAEMFKLRLKADNSTPDDEDDPDLSDSWQAVGFVAGTDADEASATKAQGFHRKNMLIITEETPGMPTPVMTAFKNTSTGGNNLILAVGNPDNELDNLHKFSLLSNVKRFRISAYDYPNVVEDNEVIPGAVTRASIQRRLVEYGENSPMYLSRVRGMSPKQSSDSLIKLEWIEQCLEAIEEEGAGAAGVDVANSENGDKAAVAWGMGNVLTRIDEFYCPNATHLAYNLIYNAAQRMELGYKDYSIPSMEDMQVDYRYVGVDAVGVGVATVNGFIDQSMPIQALQGGHWEEVIPVDEQGKFMYRFGTLRAQMYWELREDLRNRRIKIKIADKAAYDSLISELIIPKFSTSSAHIAVERKDEIKKRMGGKSPNVADAVVYWNWARKGYRIEAFVFGISTGG